MDKHKEEKVLRDVYSRIDYIAQESERPDFLVRHKDKDKESIPFGVEITEYYISNATATLANNLKAFTSYVNGDKLFNKELTKYAFPVEFQFGESTFRGVLKRPIPISEKIQALIALIDQKESKIDSYSTEQTILIINDRENVLVNQLCDIYSNVFYFAYEELMFRITNSKYFEIIITGRDKGGNLCVIPLKARLVCDIARAVKQSINYFENSFDEYYLGTLFKTLKYFRISGIYLKSNNKLMVSHNMCDVICDNEPMWGYTLFPRTITQTSEKITFKWNEEAVKKSVEIVKHYAYSDNVETEKMSWHPYDEVLRLKLDYRTPIIIETSQIDEGKV